MSPDVIRSLAAEIVNQTILGNSLFYILLVLITAVVSAGGAYIATYFAKRAEHAALRADFQSVKTQLEETTALSESIKTEIKHIGERAEKHYWVKREKLEAYVVAVGRGVRWLSEDMQFRFFDAPEPPDEDPLDTATMLQSLYLPELDAKHSLLIAAVVEFRTWVGIGMQQRLETLKTTGKRDGPQQAHCDEYSQRIAKVNGAAVAVHRASEGLARELSKV